MTFYLCRLLCFLTLCYLPQINTLITEAPLPLQLRKCYESFAGKSLSTVVGKSLCWYCEAPLRTQVAGGMKPLQPSQKRYLETLGRSVNPNRQKRQTTKRRCLRKEYRLLTPQERNDYHRAINLLKSDTTVSPNRYDAFAMGHIGKASLKAHGGPNFFGWHRVYLMMYENALQRKVPGVCLPYIDNTIEAELGDDDSYLYSDEFLGTPNGVVTSGPFANWTSHLGPLTRNVGNQGFPMNKDALYDILSRNSMVEIASPTADLEYNLEYHHGAFHIFIGGTMESIDTASFEPAFFMHHAYIDYVWELFRTKLANSGRDPFLYPETDNLRLHAGTEPLELAGTLTNREAYGNITNYDYMPSPTCSQQSPNCGSMYLACNPTTWRCYPVDPKTVPGPINPGLINPGPGPINPGTGPFNPGPGPINPGPINPGPGPISPGPGPINPGPGTINPGPINPGTGPINPGSPQNCSKNKRFIRSPKSCQNTFCIDGTCDINQWIYLPVKVISNRAPEYNGGGSFPVRNGMVETGNDIYAPRAYTNVNQYVKPRVVEPKGYRNCQNTYGIGQIFISSQGINYNGHYSESSIIDQRLATSISIAYMAVKNMGIRGKTTALLRAFDQCGRICHTACRVPGSKPAKYRPCSGVVDITPDLPKQYGTTYGDALLDVWGYKKDRECPLFDTDDFFISFYCDYQDHLPWVQTPPVMTKPAVQPQPPTAPPVVVPPQMPVPLLIDPNACTVSESCSVDIPCVNKKCSNYGKRYPCIVGCSEYALCVYGRLWGRKCPIGMKFDTNRNSCVPGSCARGARDMIPSMFSGRMFR